LFYFQKIFEINTLWRSGAVYPSTNITT